MSDHTTPDPSRVDTDFLKVLEGQARGFDGRDLMAVAPLVVAAMAAELRERRAKDQPDAAEPSPLERYRLASAEIEELALEDLRGRARDHIRRGRRWPSLGTMVWRGVWIAFAVAGIALVGHLASTAELSARAHQADWCLLSQIAEYQLRSAKAVETIARTIGDEHPGIGRLTSLFDRHESSVYIERNGDSIDAVVSVDGDVMRGTGSDWRDAVAKAVAP